jgi:putative nucleotidyltransferase with HDIG domain
MQRKMIDSSLRNEEQRTVTWFITLFFIISVGYDSFYFFIYPNIKGTTVGFPHAFYFWIYIIMFGLVPFLYFLTKNKKEYLIKYVFSVAYILLTIANDIITNYGNKEFESGNILELFIILFAPIFVSNRFYWTVSIGIICKYIILGLVLNSNEVFLGIIIVCILSLISYIFLNRFKGYVAAVKNSYDQQIEGIVKGVIATLELKDPYTRGHSERVAGYAQILAQYMGTFSKEELKAFNYACLLHDIGKIHIPDHILMKPTQLTIEEYETIQTHPTVGAEALKDVEGLTNHIDVIRSHHERWDGLGYPDKLKGFDIPVLARVISIADAFDAMTSSRSYRAAMPVEVAYSRIIEGKGTQFDPELVEVFEKCFHEWEKIHNKFKWNN